MLSFKRITSASCQVRESHKLTDLPVLFCFVFLLFSDLIDVFLTIYWLNGITTCINKGCWFLLTSDVPQLHPLFSLHYMFFRNILSGTHCTQCCCDYVWNGFISSLLISILGITYGLNVMLCNESPNIPFTVFRMRFSRGKLNLMCMCMLWPLIGWRRALKKISFYYLEKSPLEKSPSSG